MSKITEVQRQWFERHKHDALNIVEKQRRYMERLDGGPGSGNWGHVGRPGKRGGSGAGGGKAYRLTTQEGGYTSLTGAYKENEAWNKANGGSKTPKPKQEEKKPQENNLREKLKSGNATREDFDIAEYGSVVNVRGLYTGSQGTEYMRIADDKWVDTKSGYIMTSEEMARCNQYGRVTVGARGDVQKSDIDKAQNDLNDRLSKVSDIDDVEDILTTVYSYPNGITYTDKNGMTYVKIDDGKWVRQNADGRGGYKADMVRAAQIIGADYAEQHGIEPKSDVRRALQNLGVERRDVSQWDHEPTEAEIIELLSGADQTKGSCASLALAYCCNKAGDKVVDYRGGQSRTAVASNCRKLFNDPALNPVVETRKNDYASVHALQKKMEIGKEYILMTGRHAAIVKRTGKKSYEYLEMQSGYRENTWYELSDYELGRRFKCSERHNSKWESVLLDVEAVGKSKEMAKIMPFINTDPGKQKKGAGGGEK